MKLIPRYAMTMLVVLLLFPFSQALAQAGGMKGKVKEQGGKNLEGVLVRIAHIKKKELSQETKSDAKGDFEFANLPGGEYSLTFEKQGYKTFVTRKLEIIPGEVFRIRNTVELVREGDPYAVIRGAVLYGAGFTLPNASVQIERIDGEKKFKQDTLSHEGGEFAFRIKAEKAKYKVTASAKGFQPASTEIEIFSDEVRNIALTLQPVR